jgi:hypothetical protein
MSTTHVMLEATDLEKKTSTEICLDLLAALEKQFETGPIIGESREVIVHLLRGLYHRDMLLEHKFGLTAALRTIDLYEIARAFDARDFNILNARKKEVVSNK